MTYKEFKEGLGEYFDIQSLKKTILIGKFPPQLNKSNNMREFYGRLFRWSIRAFLVLPFLLTMYLVFVSYKLTLYLIPYLIYILCVDKQPKQPMAPIVPPRQLNTQSHPQQSHPQQSQGVPQPGGVVDTYIDRPTANLKRTGF